MIKEEVLSGRITYADAGVDIDAADEAVKRIWQIAQRTIGDGVLQGIGPFCATIALNGQDALVASADGLGTKSRILALLDRYEIAGRDLVSHAINDILTSGASPMFLLDYIGSSSLSNDQKERIVAGIADVCQEFHCPLVGGETADMPDVYADGDFDLVGFIVGKVERDKMIDGKRHIELTNTLMGLPSTGLHSNGYSLVRKVFGIGKRDNPENDRRRLDEFVDVLGETLGDALAKPHLCYYSQLQSVLHLVKGIAHITGGGLPTNVPRILPDGLSALIEKASWEVPPIFGLIQERGNIDEYEMFRAFNMGLGVVFAVDQSEVGHVRETLPDAIVVGEVIQRSDDRRVIIN